MRYGLVSREMQEKTKVARERVSQLRGEVGVADRHALSVDELCFLIHLLDDENDEVEIVTKMPSNPYADRATIARMEAGDGANQYKGGGTKAFRLDEESEE